MDQVRGFAAEVEIGETSLLAAAATADFGITEGLRAVRIRVVDEMAVRVTISAEAGGVTGNLMLRVIAADFTAIGATLHDPWAVLVRDALSAPVRQAIANAYAQCEAARQQGNFNALDQCIASARTTIHQITGPAHDLVLLAQIALFIDHVERQLQP